MENKALMLVFMLLQFVLTVRLKPVWNLTPQIVGIIITMRWTYKWYKGCSK